MIAEELLKKINEAAPVSRDKIKRIDEARYRAIEKLINGKFVEMFQGIHGDVMMFKIGLGGNRISASDWKNIGENIDTLDIRWIEVSDKKVSFGLKTLNEYDV